MSSREHYTTPSSVALVLTGTLIFAVLRMFDRIDVSWVLICLPLGVFLAIPALFWIVRWIHRRL